MATYVTREIEADGHRVSLRCLKFYLSITISGWRKRSKHISSIIPPKVDPPLVEKVLMKTYDIRIFKT